jgi:superfamily II DNA/RNA helicase
MKSFLQTGLYRHWVHQTQCLNNINVRYMGHSTEAYAFALAKDALEPRKPPSFEALGLRPPIVASLQAAFPNVKHPTETQAQFIPAVLSGKDLLLKDETGSGKSVCSNIQTIFS